MPGTKHYSLDQQAQSKPPFLLLDHLIIIRTGTLKLYDCCRASDFFLFFLGVRLNNLQRTKIAALHTLTNLQHSTSFISFLQILSQFTNKRQTMKKKNECKQKINKKLTKNHEYYFRLSDVISRLLYPRTSCGM